MRVGLLVIHRAHGLRRIPVVSRNHSHTAGGLGRRRLALTVPIPVISPSAGSSSNRFRGCGRVAGQPAPGRRIPWKLPSIQAGPSGSPCGSGLAGFAALGHGIRARRSVPSGLANAASKAVSGQVGAKYARLSTVPSGSALRQPAHSAGSRNSKRITFNQDCSGACSQHPDDATALGP